MMIPLLILFDSIKFGLEVFYLFIKTCLIIIFVIVAKLFPSKKKSIDNQIVLVTGAGQGIGKELSIQLSDLGCTVICVDMNFEKNLQTADFINSKNKSKKAYAFVMDVTNRTKVFEVSKEILNFVGDVDILINNAGIMTPQPITSAKPEDIIDVINVNLMAHFWTILAFLPGMLQRNKGHIVGISSLAGVSGLANKSPYSASKFGVAGMMDALVEEMRQSSPGVKFTCIHPYFVNTRPDLPENLHLRLPQLEPAFVAKEIINAILEEKEAISIPSHLYFFAHILRILPKNLKHEWRDLFYTNIELVENKTNV